MAKKKDFKVYILPPEVNSKTLAEIRGSVFNSLENGFSIGFQFNDVQVVSSSSGIGFFYKVLEEAKAVKRKLYFIYNDESIKIKNENSLLKNIDIILEKNKANKKTVKEDSHTFELSGEVNSTAVMSIREQCNNMIKQGTDIIFNFDNVNNVSSTSGMGFFLEIFENIKTEKGKLLFKHLYDEIEITDQDGLINFINKVNGTETSQTTQEQIPEKLQSGKLEVEIDIVETGESDVRETQDLSSDAHVETTTQVKEEQEIQEINEDEIEYLDSELVSEDNDDFVDKAGLEDASGKDTADEFNTHEEIHFDEEKAMEQAFVIEEELDDVNTIQELQSEMHRKSASAEKTVQPTDKVIDDTKNALPNEREFEDEEDIQIIPEKIPSSEDDDIFYDDDIELVEEDLSEMEEEETEEIEELTIEELDDPSLKAAPDEPVKSEFGQELVSEEPEIITDEKSASDVIEKDKEEIPVSDEEILVEDEINVSDQGKIQEVVQEEDIELSSQTTDTHENIPEETVTHDMDSIFDDEEFIIDDDDLIFDDNEQAAEKEIDDVQEKELADNENETSINELEIPSNDEDRFTDNENALEIEEELAVSEPDKKMTKPEIETLDESDILENSEKDEQNIIFSPEAPVKEEIQKIDVQPETEKYKQSVVQSFPIIKEKIPENELVTVTESKNRTVYPIVDEKKMPGAGGESPSDNIISNQNDSIQEEDDVIISHDDIVSDVEIVEDGFEDEDLTFDEKDDISVSNIEEAEDIEHEDFEVLGEDDIELEIELDMGVEGSGEFQEGIQEEDIEQVETLQSEGFEEEGYWDEAEPERTEIEEGDTLSDDYFQKVELISDENQVSEQEPDIIETDEIDEDIDTFAGDRQDVEDDDIFSETDEIEIDSDSDFSDVDEGDIRIELETLDELEEQSDGFDEEIIVEDQAEIEITRPSYFTGEDEIAQTEQIHGYDDFTSSSTVSDYLNEAPVKLSYLDGMQFEEETVFDVLNMVRYIHERKPFGLMENSDYDEITVNEKMKKFFKTSLGIKYHIEYSSDEHFDIIARRKSTGIEEVKINFSKITSPDTISSLMANASKFISDFDTFLINVIEVKPEMHNPIQNFINSFHKNKLIQKRVGNYPFIISLHKYFDRGIFRIYHLFVHPVL